MEEFKNWLRTQEYGMIPPPLYAPKAHFIHKAHIGLSGQREVVG